VFPFLNLDESFLGFKKFIMNNPAPPVNLSQKINSKKFLSKFKFLSPLSNVFLSKDDIASYKSWSHIDEELVSLFPLVSNIRDK
jgi:hypothetical protein